jgi:hypothetical protein
MTKSKIFWAAAALVSLAVMTLAGYSIYTRVSPHFSGDKIEVHPVPVPLPAQAAPQSAPEAAKPAEEKAAPETPGTAKQAAQEKPKAVKTTFEYKDAKAKSVAIAGSFTSWKDIKMTKKNGVWKADIYILPGNYPYHFTVDGKKKLAPGKPKAPMGESLIKVD